MGRLQDFERAAAFDIETAAAERAAAARLTAEEARRESDRVAAEAAATAESAAITAKIEATKDAENDKMNLMNDAAEMRIYGSRGRTYTNTDPTTGATIVIADAAHPTVGRIDAIAKTRGGHTADKYRSTVDRMLGEGLELAQAEVIAESEVNNEDPANYEMNLAGLFASGMTVDQVNMVRVARVNNARGIHDMAHQLERTGVARSAAIVRAQHMYRRRDTRLVQDLLNNGITTFAEYDQLRADRNARSAATTPPANANRVSDVDAAHDEALALNNDEIDAREALWGENGIANEYARATANQRGGHLGRLERSGGQPGEPRGRFARFMRRIRRTDRHENADAVVTAQRELFQAGVNRHIEAYRAIHGDDSLRGGDLINAKLDALEALEAQIQDFRYDNAFNGTPDEQTRRDRMAIWFAEGWQNTGRVGKVLRVAAVAGVAGAAIGVGVASLGIAPLTYGGAAAAGLAGRSIGNRMARSVSRRMSGTEEGIARAERRELERLDVVETGLRATGADVEAIDITEAVELGTEREVRENQRRRKRAGAIGAVAAAAAYGGGTLLGDQLVHHASASANTAANTNNTATPANSGPNPTDLPPHGGASVVHGAASSGHEAATNLPNANDLPWNVAHSMAPGHEMSSIQHAMNSWNVAHPGQGLHFANVGNTIQIHNIHGGALNIAQQEAFNKAMELGLAA